METFTGVKAYKNVKLPPKTALGMVEERVKVYLIKGKNP